MKDGGKRMKKIIITLGVVFGVALLSSCANSSADTNKENSTDKKITVAVENDSNPLSYTDENGKLKGYEVDILKAIDKNLKDYDIKIEAVGADATQVGVDSGKYALIGGGLYKTEDREANYLLTDETSGASVIKLFRKAGSSIDSLDDLVGKKVAPVTPNGGIYNLFNDYNTEHPDAKITIQTSENATTAEKLQGIEDGTYDALVSPDNTGISDTIKGLGLSIAAADEPIKVNGTYFLLGKNQKTLKKAVDKALKTLKKNGELAKISKKWYGENIFDYKITED